MANKATPKGGGKKPAGASAGRGKVITPPGASKDLPPSFHRPVKGARKGRDIPDD